MVMLAVVYMFNFIDRQILAILLPAIKREFEVADATLGLLSGTAFALFYVTLGIPVSLLADRWNRRNLIAAAVAIWSGMTALSGLAVNFWHLVAARIGVGIGEAGCSPPAHSMIADMYPPEQRSTAMGFYTIGISAGIMLAYLAGGWVVENLGWRQAFFVVGLPGLALALLVRFTLQEPQRGASESRVDSGTQPKFLDVLRFLFARRSFLFMAFGAGLASLAGYAVVIFFPSFMDRSFGMPMAQLGIWLGLILGLAGGFGFFAGGYVADHLGQQGPARGLIFIAISVLVSAAMLAMTLLASTVAATLLLFIIPAATSNFYLAPVLAQTQGLVSLRMRALASAVMLFVINAIGLGIGPWLVGLLSDVFATDFGDESMRYSLLTVCAVALPLAALCFVLASRHLERDLANASQHD
jgi:predicted MFS family arabinose efflux permease